MSSRPYVVLSCAMSVDGYIDDASPERLHLSNDADFDRVDAERASCDAILVGANTIRRDNPRLLIRDPRRRLPAASQRFWDWLQQRSQRREDVTANDKSK